MIDNNIPQSERLEKLNLTAQKQLEKLSSNKNISQLEILDKTKIN